MPIMNGWSTPVKRGQLVLFWGVIATVLMIAAGRIVAVSTASPRGGASPVVIAEFMAANHATLLDEDGDPSDWIELWNRSNAPVDLRDWSLTDDPTRPEKWRFRDTTLAADERLIVFASGKDRTRIKTDDETGTPGFLHTNFRLDAAGGFLALYPPTARRYLDATAIDYPAQQPDRAWGLADDGTFAVYDAATPGAPNGIPSAQITDAAVLFSHARGLYDDAFALTLRTDDRGAQIVYTVDGSVPTADTGLRYDAPVAIDTTTLVRARAVAPGAAPGPVTTHTYVFPAAVAQQPAAPDGAPLTWGTHKIDFGGYRAGEPVQADYAMDPRIADDPVFGPQLRDSFAALPILSLTGGDGIWQLYADPQARGRAVEQPIAVEFFDPQGDEPGFAVDAGARIQGGAGRWEFMPKHSFRLFFRSDYGAPQLTYPFFPDSPASSFNTLVLRAGSDRGYAGHPPAPETVQDHRQDLYARDQWARDTQLAMSGLGVHGRPVHLFLNGLYWGIYTAVERPDADFWATYNGGAPEEYGVASHGGPVDGPQDRFNVLMQLAAEGGLADPARYATMLEFVDPRQFADYMILNWAMGNTDWPENNWYAGAHYPAGPNRFLVWDAEMTWIDGAAIVLGDDGWEGAPYPNVIKQVFTALMENPDFRVLFADRLYALTAAGGPLSDAVAQQRLVDITDGLVDAMVAESARWGDVRTETPITPDDWAAARADVLAQMEGNAAKLIGLASDAGFYPALEPPTFDRDEPTFAQAFDLAMTAAQGEILYTLDGTDPRAPGGAVSETAQRYNGPVPISDAVHVLARARDGEQWSPLQARLFHRPDQRSDVRITELMYNPLDGERYEFVELTNVGDLPADLTGAFFRGIDFHFPWYRTLAPGESVAVIADFKRFRERYPEAEIGGIFTGKLSDRGERIALFAQDGTLVDAVSYEDGDGWPLSADGTGDSLELANPMGDPNNAVNWRASPDLHGSPGRYE